MLMPKVSVIIPVYNAEEHLSEAVDSVLNQDFKDLEVICVDDGSTDKSSSILHKYQQDDPRLKIFPQQNSGGSAARNTGLAHAEGDYIMFLDSDDVYADGVIGDAYNCAQDNNVDIVFYNFARFVGKPSRFAIKNRRAPKENINYFTKQTYADRFFNDFAIITWNKLIRRSVISENSLVFDVQLSHNHDVDFSIRLMLAANNYAWLDRVGYFYRSNDTGLTATRRSDPTNVLKILIHLDKMVASKYAIVKPSYDKYVADMIAGTAIKYENEELKMRELLKFTHDVVIPELGLSGVEVSEPTGIFEAARQARYDDAVAHTRSIEWRLRNILKRLYVMAQGILSRFAV